eukprot:2712090-Prorocentrum_lima.AAC.1
MRVEFGESCAVVNIQYEHVGLVRHRVYCIEDVAAGEAASARYARRKHHARTWDAADLARSRRERQRSQSY